MFQALLVNLFGVRVFGELEFWMSSLKILSLAGFIILAIVIDLGGNPLHDRIGFRYWKPPNGPMGNYLQSYVHDDHLAIFLGFWSTLTTALFAYIGTELIGVTVGETKDPQKNVPRAIKQTFIRIFVFYIGTVFAISLIVPSMSKVCGDGGNPGVERLITFQGALRCQQFSAWRRGVSDCCR